MARPRKPVQSTDFAGELEKQLTAIMTDGDATVAERMKAIEIGVKLMALKHKLDPDGGSDNMFD